VRWNRRDVKCREVAKDLQSGVDIESYIETQAQDCSMHVGERARHVVEVHNWSTFRVRVEFIAECESPRLGYATEDGVWKADQEVRMRRRSAGQEPRPTDEYLSCAGLFVDQGIKMTLRCTSIGFVGTSSATLQFLLDAK
jgi:hypothetical protein